jgi:hypothetical protein
MPASAPNRRDDGALRAARDVGLIPGFPDPFDDVIDFLFRSFLRHIHNHGLVLLVWSLRAKN